MNQSPNTLSLPIEFITEPAQLQAVTDHCMKLRRIAIDTEFVRVSTYFPILGLIQVSDGEKCYLIDPVAIDDLSPLKALLTNGKVIKIFHSCSEDLEVFAHHIGCVPEPLFDTQIAAALVGQGFSLSYQGLVNRLMDVHIDKEETRSDWLQRPLSESQCQYAALDVAYLPSIYETQGKELERLGRSTWLAEECAQLSGAFSLRFQSESYYLRIKSAWKLDTYQLNSLKHLCSWREEEARRRNMPRNRVIDDKILYSLAQNGAASKAELVELNLFPGQIRRYGDLLVEMIEKSQVMDESLHPELLERPVPPKSGSILKELKQIVGDKAEELDCAPEMLARRKSLEELVRSKDDNERYTLPEFFMGWRKKVIGDELLKRLNQS